MSTGSYIQNKSQIYIKIAFQATIGGDAAAKILIPKSASYQEFWVPFTSPVIIPSPTIQDAATITILKMDPNGVAPQYVATDTNPIRYGDIVYLSHGPAGSPCLSSFNSSIVPCTPGQLCNHPGSVCGQNSNSDGYTSAYTCVNTGPNDINMWVNETPPNVAWGLATSKWIDYQWRILAPPLTNYTGVVSPGLGLILQSVVPGVGNLILNPPCPRLIDTVPLSTNPTMIVDPCHGLNISMDAKTPEYGNVFLVPTQNMWWRDAKGTCSAQPPSAFAGGTNMTQCTYGSQGSGQTGYAACIQSIPTPQCTIKKGDNIWYNPYQSSINVFYATGNRVFNVQQDCQNFSPTPPSATPSSPPVTPSPSPSPPSIPEFTPTQIKWLEGLGITFVGVLVLMLLSK